MTDQEAMKLHELIDELRTKLKKSLQDVLQFRKDLDLEREKHQLTQLRYDTIKNAINKEVDRLNQRRPDVEIPADEKRIKMTELKNEHLEVISKNKSRKHELDKLVEQLSDAKESVAVLSNAIECGFLHDKHSLILQEWIVEYEELSEQLDTHLTEVRDHE
jgi:chromosome segregation ATPase